MRGRLLTSIALCSLFAIGVAESNVIGTNRAILSGGGGVPNWVLVPNGISAAVDLDFLHGRYYQQGQGGNVANLITTSRASIGYASDTSGNFTSFANNVARITNLGLLVEEARTNAIRNNSMQGAVVGSPGTLPTNWSNTTLSGLTQQIVQTGTINGIDYVDIRVSGTTNNTIFILQCETSTQIAASTGQTWTQSYSLGLQAGSFTNVGVIQMQILSNTSGGALVAENDTNISITSSLTRFSNIATLSGGATVAAVVPSLKFNLTNGAAVDFTIRIGWPQLELGAFATSPIRTTNAAVTRAADVVTLTKVPAFGPSVSLYMKGTPSSPVSNSSNQVSLSVDDATLNNRIQIGRRSATANAWIFQESAGVTSLDNNNIPVLTQNASGRIAAAFAASDQALYGNGTQAITNASGTPPTGTLAAIHIGARADGQTQYNGAIERIALWPTTRLPNAALQQITGASTATNDNNLILPHDIPKRQLWAASR